MTEVNAPIDPLHAQAVEAVRWINEMFQEAKERAAQWEPRPLRT
jgi:hypothetical protein